MPDLAEIFRREAGRCTATLIRVLGDIDLAEDAVAEAFAIAAEQWPTEGVPPNPGGWITTTARNRAIDRLRRESTRTDRHLAALRLTTDDMEPDHDPELDDLDAFVDVVPDDQLRLMFLCCHPGARRRRPGRTHAAAPRRARHPRDRPRLPRPRAHARPADRPRQAQAARQPRPLPRAHGRRAARPAARRAGGDLPDLHRRPHRDDRRRPRPASTSRARRSASDGVLTELMPDEPEAVGLLALMLLTEARRPARTAADGSMIRLADQDRTLWDRSLIAEGHALVRACLRRDQPGPFQIQAAIAAVHADAAPPPTTDWSQIVALYDQLHALRPNAVVALNRAVAVGELRRRRRRPRRARRARRRARSTTTSRTTPPERRPPRPCRPQRRGARRLRPRHRAERQPDRTTLPGTTAGASRRQRQLGVVTRQVVDTADGCAADGGVVSVMVVEVEPVVQGGDEVGS